MVHRKSGGREGNGVVYPQLHLRWRSSLQKGKHHLRVKKKELHFTVGVQKFPRECVSCARSMQTCATAPEKKGRKGFKKGRGYDKGGLESFRRTQGKGLQPSPAGNGSEERNRDQKKE